MVLLADVRSVGVQGDGRTYGHPVVLRPVTSEDAMTADWARLPYDLLETDLHPDHQRGAPRSTGSPSTSPASRPGTIPPTMVWRQPFPGPGLGIRIIGEVTRERLDILRAADLIAREELTAAGLDRDVWQFPVVLLADVRSVGVQGDGRTYGHPVVLRPVTSEDAMTADWARLPFDLLERISTRITNEVARGQPGHPRHHLEAPGHHRVGVSNLPRDDELFHHHG